MSLLPSENHTLIIQTFAEKEPEPCEIKINVTREENIRQVQYIFSTRSNLQQKIKARQSHKVQTVLYNKISLIKLEFG